MTSIHGFLQQEAAACVLLVTALNPLAVAQDNLAPASQGVSAARTGGPAPTNPAPHVSFDGPALKFDFPEVRIGVAEYEEGPTVPPSFTFPSPLRERLMRVAAVPAQSTPTF